MKWLLPFLWIVVLAVLVFVDDLDALITHQNIHFHFVPHPKFSDLLLLSDVRLSNPFWLVVKTGHLLGFAILERAFLLSTGKKRLSIVLALSLAILSEVLQLFFARDGRILDMCIDALGIFIWTKKEIRDPNPSRVSP